MKVYIVLSTWNNNGDTDTRKIEAVAGSLPKAQEIILEAISKDLEMGGYAKVSDFIESDIENSNHNHGALKSTDPNFRTAFVNDGLDCPEREIVYEIEERFVLSEAEENEYNENVKNDTLFQIIETLKKKGRTKAHKVEIPDKKELIYQVLDGKGYLDFSSLFYVSAFWVENDTLMVSGIWQNADLEIFPIKHYVDEEYGEESWWKGLEGLAELAQNASETVPWSVVYEEEYPDSNGYCSSGVISDGKYYLFFNICRDDNELIEHCSVRSELIPIEGSEICRFAYTKKNFDYLLDRLADCGEHYCGEECPICNSNFEPATVYVLATLHFKDTPEVQENLIIKVSTDYLPDEDDKVFFYCNGVADLEALKDPDNGQDFVVEAYAPIDTIYDE